jgi:2-polyprenyl-3-methyl-5-hydroxy-6-metoxy-1,4-benzoquinol methylase
VVGKTLAWLGTRLWPARYFEQLYARTPDPWACETRPYELTKAERTADAIIRLQTAGAVLDVGCGEGLLADRLGARGYTVSGVDISPSAVDRARLRCAAHARVHIAVADVLAQPLPGRFDIIVLSEILGYLTFGRKRRIICDRMVDAVNEGGYIVVTGPWPASRTIERALRTHPWLALLEEETFADPPRPYSLSIYRRLSAP